MGLSPSEIGLVLDESDVAGFPGWEVAARGICACGHRMAKHRYGHCEGVPTGRKTTHAKVEDNACVCREPRPVLMVKDGRLFQLSWKVAHPAHPFTAAVRALDPAKIEAWLIETPPRCENPECTTEDRGVGRVRMAYQPGTRRMRSALTCPACAPESGL